MVQPYQLTSGISILRIADDAWIPPDFANMDYRAYQEWIAAGNIPDPAPAPVPAQSPSLADLQTQLATLTAQIATFAAKEGNA